MKKASAPDPLAPRPSLDFSKGVRGKHFKRMQEGTNSPQSASAVPLVPTTKILAIGATKATLTREQRALILPHEVPETVQLYLNGKIDQWWFRQDGKGVVFLMNVTSVEEARSLLEQLPLGKAKLMEFEYMPLGPLAPLRVLLNTPAK